MQITRRSGLGPPAAILALSVGRFVSYGFLWVRAWALGDQMTISPVSSAVGGMSLLGSARSPSSSSGAGFGPAFALGGSAPIQMQGYDAYGQQLAAKRSAVSGPASSSKAAKERLAILHRAAAKIDTGFTESGRADAETLLAKNGSDTTALRLVAHSYLAEKNYEEAERAYTKALALAPDSARLRGDVENMRELQKSDDEVIRLAKRKIKNGQRREDGLRLLIHLTDRSPNNTDAYLALAEGFRSARQTFEVIGAVQEAVRSAGSEDMGRVIESAQNLVDDNPDVGLTHNILGRALQKAGSFRRAIGELDQAVKIAPDNSAYREDLASGYVARAKKRLGIGDMFSAQSDIRMAESIDPANDGIDLVQGQFALAQGKKSILAGRYSDALAKLNTADSKGPKDAQFRRALAASFIQVASRFDSAGSDEQAFTSFAKALKLDPSSLLAKRKVGELGHQEGLAAIDRLDYDSAISHLDQAYETSRTNDAYRTDLARAYDLRGELMLSAGKLDEALADFKRGFSLDSSNQSLSANLSSTLNAVAAA